MTKTTTRSTSINVRLDPETRRALQDFADRVGIPATTLVAADIKEMLRRGTVRLEPALEPTPHLEKILHDTEADIKAGRNLSPAFDSVDELFAYLDKK